MTSFSKKIKTVIKNGLNKLPYIRTLHRLNSNSSVVSFDDIKARQQEIGKFEIKEIPGIELNLEDHQKLIREFSLTIKSRTSHTNQLAHGFYGSKKPIN